MSVPIRKSSPIPDSYLANLHDKHFLYESTHLDWQVSQGWTRIPMGFSLLMVSSGSLALHVTQVQVE